MSKKLIWSTTQRVVDELLPLNINPRKISEEKRGKLIQSIEKFNLAEIPAINSDNTIIAGHQRIKALQLIGRGQDKIDVRIPNRKLIETEVKEYNVISNIGAGEWDVELLQEHFSDIDLEGWGLDLPEFEQANKAEDDDFEPQDTNTIKTDIVLGDLFEIGDHRLLCGDSTCKDTVTKLMDGKKADMVFTDPPYNTGMSSNMSSTRLSHIFDDDYTEEEWQALMVGFCSNYDLFTKDNIFLFVCLDWRRSYELVPNLKKYWKMSNLIVWDKMVHGLGSDYKYTHEFIHVCKKGKPNIACNKQGDREYQDVWRIQRKMGRDEEHTTKKPIELCERSIKHTSKQGDIIFDLFLGSGSTMIAAHQLKRKCYGMELDPKYNAVIILRMLRLDESLKIKRNGVDETQEWLNKA